MTDFANRHVYIGVAIDKTFRASKARKDSSVTVALYYANAVNFNR